jgi:hypothetical protein
MINERQRRIVRIVQAVNANEILEVGDISWRQPREIIRHAQPRVLLVFDRAIQLVIMLLSAVRIRG